MSIRIPNLVSVGVLMVSTLVAFASGSGGSDALVGAFTGDWTFHRKSRIDGVIDAGNTGEFTQQIGLGFDSDRDARIDQVVGKWKPDGNRFRIDCTPAATALVIADSGDPKATHVLKGKRIRRVDAEHLTGRVSSVQKFRVSGERHKNSIKGSFHCALEH